MNGVLDYLYLLIVRFWQLLLTWVPTIVVVVAVLFIGWVAGRMVGRGVSKVLDKAGVDDAIKKTAIGKAIEKSGMTVVHFLNLLIRWFVYLIAILAAVNILNIAVLSQFMTAVVGYLPSFLAGVFIILIGFIVADFAGDAVRSVGEEAEVEYSALFGDALKLFLYVIVLVMGLQTMKIDVGVVYVFATPLAWGLAAGIGVGMGIAFGWGFKDVIAGKAKEWIEGVTKTAKGAEKAREKKAK